MPSRRTSGDLEASASDVLMPAARKQKTTSGMADGADHLQSTSKHYSLETLLSWEPLKLAEYAMQLQDMLAASNPPALSATSENTVQLQPAAPAQATMTAQEIRAKGHDLRDKIRRGVTSVMKWSNSCRTGKARWAYSTGVACEEVVLAAFGLQGDQTKNWKQKKASLNDFQACVGEIQKSIRYDYLVLTGENVNVRWKTEDNTVTVSGTYGKST